MAKTKLTKRVTRQLIKRLAEQEKGFRRKTVRLVGYFFILYLIYMFCGGDYGLFRIYRLTKERNQLREKYMTTVAEAADYQYRLRRLESDPQYVEWLARTRYGYSRPGEIIYHLKSPR